MKELAQWVVTQLQPYQTAELADAQDRNKELERQLAQQRKRTHTEAEIGAEPIGSSEPSEPPQPEGTPSSKTVRLPFKSKPSQAKPSKGKGKHKPSSQEAISEEDPRTLTEKAFDPEFTSSKVLSSNAPLTTSAQAITKWIAKLCLKDELKAQLQQSCKVAAATLKSCTVEEIHILRQRAVDLGYPVRHLKKANDGEILKIVWHLDWRIRKLDVAMKFEQSLVPFSCSVKPAYKLPSMICHLLSAGWAFVVFCAFAVFFLLFRRAGTGKQGRWRQRFAQFRDNKLPSIFEVQEWFETPFTCYLVAPVQLEPDF